MKLASLSDPVVLGIAVDLGSITNSAAPTVWSLGIVRDPVIQYINPSTNQAEDRNSYFWSNYSNIEELVRRSLFPNRDPHLTFVTIEFS